MTVAADVRLTNEWSSSLFPALEDASEFFRRGSAGWAPSRDGRALEGLELRTDSWQVIAAAPNHIESSYFDSLPPGAATLDNILVMRDIPVQWATPDTSMDAHPRSMPLRICG